jgi:CIC family chloride channel protein
MLLVGIILYGFISYSEEWFGQPNLYYVQGVGYATILDILREDQSTPQFLLLLFAMKLLVTCLTLGSGASGGIFSPGLFLGATLGAAVGWGLKAIWTDLPVEPVHFALAGMAGMVAGTTGAVMTGIVMVFELTRDYSVIMPAALTAAIATAVRQVLVRPTIYTLKLLRRGDVVPQGLQAWIDGERRAKDLMTTGYIVIASDGTLEAGPVRHALQQGLVVLLADHEHHIRGVIDAWAEDDPGGRGSSLHRLHRAPYITAIASDRLPEIHRRMEQAQARVVLIMRKRASLARHDLVGIITQRQLAKLSQSAARLME